MRFSLASFGRSGLDCRSSRFTVRRAVRLFLAARRRWPAGRLAYSRRLSLRWEYDGGMCGVLISRL